MLGKRSAQIGFFEADQLYLEQVGRDSFYGFLASQRGQLFQDEDFAKLYCLDNGRTSVPPSLLATVLLLQTYDRVSDEEAKARADFDLRWKVALGIAIEDRPFAKSTLQLFRAQLILHEEVLAIFQKSLAFARKQGHLKGHKVKAVLDTTNILGRGAVKDTYNLLADGISKLVRVLASLSNTKPEVWAEGHALSRYFRSSIKGEAVIDWGDAKARRAFLGGIVADADRLMETAREELQAFAADSAEYQRLTEAATLLRQLLLQDIERKPDGPAIKEGVSPDRVISVRDPEMRHGRKSAAKRFDGHKVGLAVDPESQLITAVTVLPGNGQDHEQALSLVEQTEANAQVEVSETIGDCAYGDGETRKAFAEAGRTLTAKVPDLRNQTQFPKEMFRIDLEQGLCICPAGQECRKLVSMGRRKKRVHTESALLAFQFAAEVCDVCPLRASCLKARLGRGRLVMLHPQEELLQAARTFQRSAAFAPLYRLRQAAEHRIARLVQLGVRQARYFGRAKTLFQMLLAATVANLTLVASKTGLMRRRSSREHHRCSLSLCLIVVIVVNSLILSVGQLVSSTSPANLRGFRPGF